MENTRPGEREAASVVAEMLTDQFAKWASEKPSQRRRDELKRILSITFAYHGLDDGYVIARQLEEDYMVEADEDLVILMSDVSILMNEEIDSLTEEWVRSNRIVPQFKKGDRVKAKLGLRSVEGIIESVLERTAKYGIAVSGSTGLYIVEFERVTEPEPAMPA